MILEFICNGYDKKTYEEITYSIEMSVAADYLKHFNELLEKGKLTASHSNDTINIALRELSWFKNIIFRHVTAINEKSNHAYLVMLEWSTDDECDVDYYLYKNYNAAKDKYDRLVEDENDADISWVGSEVFDENGEVNEGYEFEYSEDTDGETNLCWKVIDTNSNNRYSVITLTKVEIL